MKKESTFFLLMAILFSFSFSHPDSPNRNTISEWSAGDTIPPIMRSEAEWKEILSPEQYHVLREKGTERPFTGELLKNNQKGTYTCAGCGLVLFESDTKFKSGCGWPSFYDSYSEAHIKEIPDYSHGMERTELVCAGCNGHLGHIFDDGPMPTGKRFCINSASLDFEEEK